MLHNFGIAYIIRELGSLAISYFSSSNNNDRPDKHNDRHNYDMHFMFLIEKLANIGDQQSKLIFVVEVILGVIVFAVLVIFFLISIIILIMVLYGGWKFMRWLLSLRRNNANLANMLPFQEARDMIEDMAGIRGRRLQIHNGQHINNMIEIDDENAGGRLNSKTLYEQQMETAKRRSLQDRVRMLEEELQRKELRKSTRHNLGDHRPRDIRPGKKPSKAFRNELEYETYIPTNDTDGGLRRRKRCDSRQRHNDLTTDPLNEFHDSQEEKLLFYYNSPGVEDIPCEDYSCDNPREVEGESFACREMRTTMWDDEEILDPRELEELQLATAMSRSIEEQ